MGRIEFTVKRSLNLEVVPVTKAAVNVRNALDTSKDHGSRSILNVN
jgi:hypothetical protein